MPYKRKAVPTIGLLLAATACAPAGNPGPGAAGASASAAPGEVRNVVFMVGDGTGLAYWSAARFVQENLAVEQMPVVGLVDTRSSSSRVTDSAAGATVYAAGLRTYNGAIGVGPECREMVRRDSLAMMRDPASCAPVELVTDLAERQGMSTGLVATSTITHATPASFGAHVPFRSMEPAIAEQLAASEIDVLLGGGRAFFDGSDRPDGRDLLQDVCRTAACLSTAADLAGYRADDRRLVGLFAAKGMEVASERQPELTDMTRAALARLSRDPDGFFLLVEGSQPDWRGHDNRPVQEVVDEVLDFDRAIGAVLEFARANPGTLVVVTADHETGGLALVEESGELKGLYSTGGHTASMVPLFAYGPGAERFGGIRDNDEVGRILREMVQRP